MLEGDREIVVGIMTELREIHTMLALFLNVPAAPPYAPQSKVLCSEAFRDQVTAMMVELREIRKLLAQFMRMPTNFQPLPGSATHLEKS